MKGAVLNRFLSDEYLQVEQIPQSKITSLKAQVAADNLYYPQFHLAPNFGLLNDPNGLAYFNGEYQIFYQYCPNGPIHGMKSWHHLTTKDFINYVDRGTPLKASESFDNYGIYSGGAYVENGKLNLLYTGNSRNVEEGYKRYPYQCRAIMNQDYQIEKKEVIIQPDFKVHTEHFRDPVKYEDNLIIGAQSVDKKAKIAVYNLTTEKMSYLKTNLPTDDAYMYECPNVLKIKDQELLVYSPQGSSVSAEKNRNIYDVYYSIDQVGSINSGKWTTNQAKRLDYGFDFYAPQLFDDGKRIIMYAWAGQAGGITQLDQQLGWSQMLSLPREIKIIDNHIYQQVLDEYQQLINSSEEISGTQVLKSRQFKLEITVNDDLKLKIGNDDDDLILRTNGNQLSLDRSQMSQSIAVDYGTERVLHAQEKITRLEIYVDNSIMEIFVNEGKYTMTSRFLIEDLSMITFIADNYEATINYMNAIKIEGAE